TPGCHSVVFFSQAEDGIRDVHVTGVQTCALPISPSDPLPTDPDWAGGSGSLGAPGVLADDQRVTTSASRTRRRANATDFSNPVKSEERRAATGTTSRCTRRKLTTTK